MNRSTRDIVIGVCALAIVGSVATNLLTGSAAFTKFPSEEIEAMNEQDDLGALFDDTAPETQPEPDNLDNKFVLGWLPSGPGLDALSVLSISGAAAFAAGATALVWRRGRRHTPADG